jgi:hypothetical protein
MPAYQPEGEDTMMTRRVVLVAIVALFLAACASGPSAKIKSTTYEDGIIASGVKWTYQGQQIIQITLDFTFDKSLTADLDPAAEDYRKQLYAILVEGAHFYYADQEVKLTYGYWPSEAGDSFAKEMSLFYVVPAKHDVKDLKFVFDGSVLGEGAKGLDTAITPKR